MKKIILFILLLSIFTFNHKIDSEALQINFGSNLFVDKSMTYQITNHGPISNIPNNFGSANWPGINTASSSQINKPYTLISTNQNNLIWQNQSTTSKPTHLMLYVPQHPNLKLNSSIFNARGTSQSFYTGAGANINFNYYQLDPSYSLFDIRPATTQNAINGYLQYFYNRIEFEENMGNTWNWPYNITNISNNQEDLKTYIDNSPYTFESSDWGFSDIIVLPNNYTNNATIYLEFVVDTTNTTTINSIISLLQSQLRVMVTTDVATPSNELNPFQNVIWHSTPTVFIGGFDKVSIESKVNMLGGQIGVSGYNPQELLLYFEDTTGDLVYNTTFNAGFPSKIIFYGFDGGFKKGYTLKDLPYSRVDRMSGYYYVDLTDSALTGSAYFTLELRRDTTPTLDPDGLTRQQLSEFQSKTYYEIDNNIFWVNYYNNLNLYVRQPYSRLITNPYIGIPAGYLDTYYVNPLTNEREPFDFTSTPFTPNLNLFMRFSTAQTIELQIPIDNDFEQLLYDIGFLNTAGLMFIYVLLLVSINLSFFFLKFKNRLIIIISNIFITIIFAFLGYIPLFVSIIMTILFIYFMIKTLKVV